MVTNYINKDYFRSKLPQYLNYKGINTNKNFKCLAGTHSDTHPSMALDKKNNRVICFQCDAKFDIFDLIGKDFNLHNFKDQYLKAQELFGGAEVNYSKKSSPEPTAANTISRDEKNYADYYARMHNNIGNTDYPAIRGLSLVSTERFNIGYDEHFKVNHNSSKEYKAIIIPTSSTSFIARMIDSNEKRYLKHGSSHFLNIDALDKSTQPIFIVEGEIDALSIIELGGEAIALGSTANCNSFVDMVLQHSPSQPLILALDNDEPGYTAENKLLDKLLSIQISVSAINIYGDYKDANEALTSDRAGFKAALEQAKIKVTSLYCQETREYLKKCDAALLPHFIKDIKLGTFNPIVETGFPLLDNALGNGIFEGLYILGAPSSLGKTTFTSQVATNIATQGNTDVLWFTLEMQRSQMMAVNISRISAQLSSEKKSISIDHALSSRQVLSGLSTCSLDVNQKLILQEAQEEYGKIAEHIFTIEGMGDISAISIKNSVEEHIKLTGRVPIVVVDYLQLVAPLSSTLTDKQNVDKTVLVLKKISTKYHTAVITISSFNRNGYYAPAATESFKESGNIEYTSDVLMGLQFEGVENNNFKLSKAKAAIPRKIELSIIKNRFGSAGKIIKYNYFAKYNLFVERQAS